MDKENLPHKEIEQPSHEASAAHAKACLNCGAELRGEYCSRCGQKDGPSHEPFKELVAEVFSGLFHFDSKFFRTLSPLLFKPGFLTNEYTSGKRAHYVHPIR